MFSVVGYLEHRTEPMTLRSTGAVSTAQPEVGGSVFGHLRGDVLPPTENPAFDVFAGDLVDNMPSLAPLLDVIA